VSYDAKTWSCPQHRGVFTQAEECHECVARMERPIPATPAARAAEIREWAGMVLTVKFSRLHGRMEKLCGRPVFTHEFAWPEELAKEVEAGRRIGVGEAIGKIHEHFPDKPVIVVAASSPEGAE
jgi:hypothetical protein